MSGREGSLGRLASREENKKNSEETESEQSPQDPSPSAEPEPDASPAASDSEGADTDPEPAVTSESQDTESPAEVNVKDRDKTLFMYLPQDLHNEIDIACQSVNLTYKIETGENLGKNRYLYPIVLKAGVDGAMDLEFEEIQDLVAEIDRIEDGY